LLELVLSPSKKYFSSSVIDSQSDKKSVTQVGLNDRKRHRKVTKFVATSFVQKRTWPSQVLACELSENYFVEIKVFKSGRTQSFLTGFLFGKKTVGSLGGRLAQRQAALRGSRRRGHFQLIKSFMRADIYFSTLRATISIFWKSVVIER